jgi:hypothetical protein
MLISSNINNYTSQTNNTSSKKTNDSDYLHRAIKHRVPGEQNKLEFRDTESGKLVEIYVHEEIQKHLKTKFDIEFEDDITLKATGEFENYLQTMWSKYQNETNSKDENRDGYLDKNELLKSRRNIVVGHDENNKVALYDSKVQIWGEAEDASTSVDEYLEKKEIYDGRIALDHDFNSFLYGDKDLDTNYSNTENLLSSGLLEDEINPDILLRKSGFSTEQTVQKQLEEWAEQLKEKGLKELYDTSASNSEMLKNITDALGKNESYNDISADKLSDIKERLSLIQNYTDVQTDSAKIFSLKV